MACLCLCFPEITSITTKHGVKTIGKLQPNDQVLTISKNGKSGSQKWTKFYTFAHKEADRIAEFLLLKTNDGKELVISADHLIFVAEPGKGGRRLAKKAGEICKGDKLFHLNPSTSKMELVPVAEITVGNFTGVFAPLTMSGDFLANGFFVSCYANKALRLHIPPLRHLGRGGGSEISLETTLATKR